MILDTRPDEIAKTLVIKEVGAQARETFVLIRGNANAESDKVEPGFPSVLSPPEPEIAPSPHGNSSGRRTALANWIASPENPLTARALWLTGCGNTTLASASLKPQTTLAQEKPRSYAPRVIGLPRHRIGRRRLEA